MNEEAPESSRIIEIQSWLELNKMRLITGIVVVGIISAAVYVSRYVKVERERLGSAALVKLQMKGDAADPSEAVSAAQYVQVSEDHPGTRAAARAVLLAAGQWFEEGRYAEAHAEFEKASQLNLDRSLAASAALGIAASLDAMGKSSEATTAYQDVISRHANSPVASQAKLGLAELYEAQGQPAQALNYYSQLTNNLASAWSTEALVRRERLLTAHPELAPPPPSTNAPTVLEAGSLTNSLVPPAAAVATPENDTPPAEGP